MLVSHDHKFIYIKSRKTASTTIQEYLKPYCENGIIEDKKAHRPAESIREIIGKEAWDTYTKICPIRNPWDKMVSYYFWKRRLPLVNRILHSINKNWGNYSPAHKMDFNEFMEYIGEYNLDGKILFVDGEWPDYHFIRQEHLEEDLEKVCEIIGIPFEKNRILNKKAGFRPGSSYRDFYNEKSREIVAKAYKREIEKMGYEF